MMHTKFSGSNGQNAYRWLRTLRYENPEIATISPSDWLGIIDGLLEGDAATWADYHPRVKHILRAGSLKEATRADVETFKKALVARFPPVEVEISDSRPGLIVSSPVLEQAPYEDLDSYYQRSLMLLYQNSGVDLIESPLTEQEHTALKKTIKSYIAGLVDSEVRRDAEKVWLNSQASLSLHQIHKLSKDKTLRKWLGKDEKRMEKPFPGQAAGDQGVNGANAPNSDSDTADLLGDLGNIGPFDDARANFDYYFKPKNEKHAAGADDMRTRFDDFIKGHPDLGNEMPTAEANASRNFFGDPESAEETTSSKHGPFPELRPWNPAMPITDNWNRVRNQLRNPPPEKGFTSRIGNSHHTPNTSNGSNPPTTLPNANMFGGGTGTPSRSQSSLFNSIFDDRHPANTNWTAHPAYATNNKHFGDGSVTGANCGNPPQHFTGMPPPGLSRFEPLNKKPTGGLFGNGTPPDKPAKGTSPNRHSRGPSNLKVDTHLRPSSLSKDTVRQFYSPGRNIFGHFSTKSPNDVADAANSSNSAANTSTSTSHQGPSIQMPNPSVFDTPSTTSSGSEDYQPRDSNKPSQARMDKFMRFLKTNPQQDPMIPKIFNTPGLDSSVHEDRKPQESKIPSETPEEKFLRYFGPNRQQNPMNPNIINTPHLKPPVPEYRLPNESPDDLFMRFFGQNRQQNPKIPNTSNTPVIAPPVPGNNDGQDTTNPFKDSMDKFMRELNLDTQPSDADIAPPHHNENANEPASPPPKTPTTAVFSPPTYVTSTSTTPNPSSQPTAPTPPPSYARALNTKTDTPSTAHTRAPFQPTVESDPEEETKFENTAEYQPEIPITIKQSQGQKKKTRGQGGKFKA